MASLGNKFKQPAEKKDYDLNYTDWLTTGDNVAEATVNITPEGLTKEVVVADPRVKIWLWGGVHNTTYRVTVTMTSADGRVQQDEFNLKVKEV